MQTFTPEEVTALVVLASLHDADFFIDPFTKSVILKAQSVVTRSDDGKSAQVSDISLMGD